MENFDNQVLVATLFGDRRPTGTVSDKHMFATVSVPKSGQAALYIIQIAGC